MAANVLKRYAHRTTYIHKTWERIQKKLNSGCTVVKVAGNFLLHTFRSVV